MVPALPVLLILPLAGPQAVDPAQLAALASALAAPEAAALEALPPEHAEEAIAVLAERRVPDASGGTRLLAPAEDERLLAWLAALPAAELRRVLAELLGGGAPYLAREVGVRALERAGLGEDLVLLARLARPDSGLEARRAARRFEAAAAAAALREAPSFSTVLRTFDEAHAALLPGVLCAAEGCGEEPLPALARLLNRRGDADGLVLAALERSAWLHTPPHDARVSNEVERLAVGGEPATSIAAIGVLEALDQTEAVELLVGLLDHQTGGVRERARQALEALTGQHLDGPEAWRAWLDAEEEWWWKAGERALARLPIAGNGEFAALVGDLGRHRLYRHTIAPRLVDELGLRPAPLTAYAAAVLGNLGSPSAAPALSALAQDHPTPDVRRAAASALAHLSASSRRPPAQEDRP